MTDQPSKPESAPGPSKADYESLKGMKGDDDLLGARLIKQDPFATSGRRLPLAAIIGVIAMLVCIAVVLFVFVLNQPPAEPPANENRSNNAEAVNIGSDYMAGLRNRGQGTLFGVYAGMKASLTPEEQERLDAEEERLVELERILREQQRPGRTEAAAAATRAYRSLVEGWQAERGPDTPGGEPVPTPWPTATSDADVSMVIVEGVIALPAPYRDAYAALDGLLAPDAEVSAVDTSVYPAVAEAADAFRAAITRARAELFGERLPARARELIETGNPQAALRVYSFETVPEAMLWPDESRADYEDWVFPDLTVQFVLPALLAHHFAPAIDPLLEAEPPRYGDVAAAIALDDTLRLLLLEGGAELDEWSVDDAISAYRREVLAVPRQEYLDCLVDSGRRTDAEALAGRTQAELDAIESAVRNLLEPVIEDWGLPDLAREATTQLNLYLDRINKARETAPE